jgi:Tfp pilus assembly protein PilZ
MNIQTQVRERREAHRLPDSLVIRHRPLGTKMVKERSVSKDLSKSGVSIPTSKRFHLHSTVELEITLPMQLLPLFALGEIVWTKESWENARRSYQVGVRITDMDEYDEKRIRKYVRQRVKENKE